jgi:hypothetical protein
LDVTTEINVLALVKGNERYVFLFDDDNRVEMLRQFGRFAANPDLSFTWYDAAVMSQKVRQAAPMERAEPAPRRFELSSRFSLPVTDDVLMDGFDGEAAA